MTQLTLKPVVEMMFEKGIGSLGVSSNGSSLVGIITKSDIVQHCAQKHAGTHKIGDVMTISYVSMNSDDSLRDVVSKMVDEKNF